MEYEYPESSAFSVNSQDPYAYNYNPNQQPYFPLYGAKPSIKFKNGRMQVRMPKPKERIESCRLSKVYIALNVLNFSRSVKSLWENFYGKNRRFNRDVVKIWFKVFRRQLGVTRVKISNTFFVMLKDGRTMSQKGPPSISYLMMDQVHALQVKDFDEMIERQRIWLESGLLAETLDDMMKSETSPLQLCLIPANEIPGPQGWQLDNMWLPFQTFLAIVNGNFESMRNAPHRMDPVGIKIRYVEMIANAKFPHDQLLMGILTAFGPNIYTYPLRVIQVLVSRGLIREYSPLLDCVTPPKKKAFESLDAEFNTFFKFPTSLNLEEKTNRPEPITPLPHAPLKKAFFPVQKFYGASYPCWKVAVEKALLSIGLPTPPAGYNEIFNTHLLNQDGTDEFLQGMLTGILVGNQLRQKVEDSGIEPNPKTVENIEMVSFDEEKADDSDDDQDTSAEQEDL